MKVEKRTTDTYVIGDLPGLDPVTAYVTNHAPGRGQIIIECFGDVWTASWGGMGQRTLQEFVCSADNDYIINKMTNRTRQTDFDQVEALAKERGFEICATTEVELAMMSKEMSECFGSDWMMDLPTCLTNEYMYLGRILDAVKAAFQAELPIEA